MSQKRRSPTGGLSKRLTADETRTAQQVAERSAECFDKVSMHGFFSAMSTPPRSSRARRRTPNGFFSNVRRFALAALASERLIFKARKAAMEFQNLIHEDSQRGIFRVHRSAFTSAEIAQFEQKNIFDKCWLYLGHESEVEKPGDFRRRTVGGRSLFWVRGSDGVVRAFYNTCTHWGAN